MAASSPNFLIHLPEQICSTPAWRPISPNSTYTQIVSPCLAKVLIPALPMLLSMFSLILLLLHPLCFPTNGQRLTLGKLCISKLLLSLINLLLASGHIVLALCCPGPASSIFCPSNLPVPEQFNSAICSLCFCLFSFLAYGQSIRCGFITSGSLHMAWFIRLFSLFPDLVLIWFCPKLVPADLAIIFLHISLAFGMTLLLCAADSPFGHSRSYQPLEMADQEGKEETPENRVSAISSMVYWYASAMVWRGLRGTIDFDKLWALDKKNHAKILRDNFYRTAKQHDGLGQQPPITIFSFFWRFFICIWGYILLTLIYVVAIVLGRYSNASFLRIIVNSVNAQNPVWLSIVALSALFLIDFTGKLLTARRDFYSFRIYFNLRSVLTTAIFDKMLRLSAAGRARYSAGEVLNLLTTDGPRILWFFFQIRDFVYCPLMVLVAFVGLFMEIGWNTVFGIIILISVLPINYALSKLNVKYEQIQMGVKDSRLKLVNDVLSGIKVLKLYAWEESMKRQIFELRQQEMLAIRKIFLLDVLTTVSFQLAPLIATLVSFFGYAVLQGNPMRPDVAFVSLLFFSMLRFSIYQIPQLLTMSIKAWVSGKRVLAFLNEQEQQPSHIVHKPVLSSDQEGEEEQSPVVLLQHCSFSWSSITTVASPSHNLHDISLEVKRGQLIGIVGRVGTGKSSLLAAILGEMERALGEGEAIVRASKIGYVPQQPWIQNRTLRSNVLFDSQMNERRYGQVLKACALEDDLRLLVAGDLTEIGEKGINLSGGQKARVALARAVYMDADLYMLDDTLSAVDAHVGAHIFDQVIGNKGMLAKKTRIWALNSLAFLHHCDKIVVMEGGRINSIGTLEELKRQTEGPFAELIREFMKKHLERRKSTRSGTIEGEEDDDDQELAQVLKQLSGSPLSLSLLEHRRQLEQQADQLASRSVPSTNGIPIKPTNTIAPPRHLRQSSQSSTEFPISSPAFSTSFSPHQQQTSSMANGQHFQPDTNTTRPDLELLGKLTDEEELATGMVSRRVYLTYIRAFGVWLSIAYLLTLFLGSSTFEALSTVWLAKWSSAPGNSTAESARNLAIYGGLNTVNVIFTAISGVIITVGAYHASTTFHDQLVSSLFRCPMAFFDRTPLGRILNRLSNDIDRIDENIPWAVSIAMAVFAEALNSLISICVVIPLLTIVVLPLLAIFLFIVHFYNLASVQLRRLTSKSWSSTCSFVQDAHLGADSIRVFNVQERFRDQCCRLADFTNESYAVEVYTNRWLQIRLDIISDTAVFICILVAILMAQNGMITLGVLAMVIGCGYTFTGYLGEIARVWRESEVQMVCIERVGEYIRNEHEPEWRIPQRDRELDWPSAGRIHFRDVCLRYRPDTDLVLHNVNFEVAAGEKVGIVGRTGAGKSSLTLALFRLVEISSGQIIIDGVDIGTLGLHDLREALTIIPQDPVLFCGTLRINLDPFGEYQDERILEALEKANLKEMLSQLEGGLSHEVAESGSNLSVGQRQLVCLARALLRHRTRILVLDEATAAIDAETDARIQQSIRNHFRHCTLLTIAHRLNTILDYDRILVMDAGQVAEFDSPSTLLANSNSIFFKLAQQAGLTSSQQTSS